MKKQVIVVTDTRTHIPETYLIKGYNILLTKLYFWFNGYQVYKFPFKWIYKMNKTIGWFPYYWAWTNVDFEYFDELKHSNVNFLESKINY